MSENRKRIFSDKPSSVRYSRTYAEKDSSPIVTMDQTFPYTAKYDCLDDVKDPDFRRKQREGIVVIHPFSRLTFDVNLDVGSHYARYVNGSYWNQNTWSGALMPFVCSKVNLDPYYCVTAHYPNGFKDEVDYWFREQARQIAVNLEKSKYAFGEDVAEIRKSLSSIWGMLHDIGNIIARIPKLTEMYVKNGYTLQKAASKVWLRLRYELRPLLISAENALMIANGAMTQAIGKRQKVSQFDKIVMEENLTFTSGTTATGLWTLHRSHSVSGTINSGCIFENNDPLKSDLQQLGLGMKDIVPTVWAITRFSFLVDKFINISNLIRGMQNILDPNIRMLGGWQTTSFEYHSTCTAEFVQNDPGRTSTTHPYTTTIKSVDKERVIHNFTVADVLNLDLQVPEFETFVDLYTIFVSPSLRSAKLRV